MVSLGALRWSRTINASLTPRAYWREERSYGRKLTGQEVNLSLAQARALVETD